MIANSAVQSSTTTLIHNAILFIDTSTMFDTIMFIILIEPPYLAIIASNVFTKNIYHNYYMGHVIIGSIYFILFLTAPTYVVTTGKDCLF